MELVLNIYKNKQIEKTYSIDDFMLPMGICEDIMEVVQIDKLGDLSFNNDAPPEEFLKIFMGLFKQFKPIMKELFDGLTDEEYRRTNPSEVSEIVWGVIMYTLEELFNISTPGKNSPRVEVRK